MQKVCVVFDIGKTNKKVIVFDENYVQLVNKQCIIEGILDDDGDSCEDLMGIVNWVKSELVILKDELQFDIKAINFTAYEAALVYIDAAGKVLSPMYSYLKRYPKKIEKEFFEKYGPQDEFLLKSSSPNLGFLNAGFQLFWLKKQKTNLFKNVKNVMFLQHYLSFVFSKQAHVDFSSLGCHTTLWDFSTNQYLDWINKEHLDAICLPPLNSNASVEVDNLKIGIGLVDDIAALVPYLKTQKQDFVLISTGTWNISFNPFNTKKISLFDLQNNCLNFANTDGSAVRSSRLFGGSEHERQIKHLSNYFKVDLEFYKAVKFDFKIVQKLRKAHKQVVPNQTDLGYLRECPFVERNLNAFKTFEEAYHQFMIDLVAQQVASTKLTFGNKIPRKIFVDGGFAKNEIFMQLLAEAFFNVEVYASQIAQSSAFGAALIIDWAVFSENMLQLKRWR